MPSLFDAQEPPPRPTMSENAGKLLERSKLVKELVTVPGLGSIIPSPIPLRCAMHSRRLQEKNYRDSVRRRVPYDRGTPPQET